MGLINVQTLSKSEDTKLAISLENGKAHCFIDEDDNTQDAQITDLILTAQSIIENDPSVPYCFFLKEFSAIYEQDRERLLLPKSPLFGVEKVEEFSANTWIEVDKQSYFIEFGDDYSYVVMPYYNGVKKKLKITFKAGNSNANEIRRDCKQAVAYLLAHLYEYRGASTSLNIYDNPVYKAIISRLKRIF